MMLMLKLMPQRAHLCELTAQRVLDAFLHARALLALATTCTSRWLVIERLFDFAASVMGTDDLAIEPSVFAWLLDPPSGEVNKAGNNGFHLPHRDFSYTETFDGSGAIQALSIWV